MKLQDVILKAIAKKITWLEAAEIIGVCDRTMRRMRKQYEEFGYNGLFDQRRRKRIYLRVPMETAERVLALYRDTYFDLSVRHFHEKLREEHAIEISYTWVKQALQGAGLVARRKKRGSHRRRRPRKPIPGMLLHIDGSTHRWFSDDRYYDLLVILDDATSEIYYAQLVDEEGTRTLMPAVRSVVEKQGIFCALYSDRASHFFVTPKAGGKVDPNRVTQLGRALQELGIQMIPAYSPAGTGTDGAQLPDVAGAISARVTHTQDHHGGGREPLSARRICGGVQPAIRRSRGGKGKRVRAHAAQRPGLGVFDSARKDGESRQYHRAGESDTADRKDALAGYAGRLYGDGSRVSGRARGGALRAA